MPLRVYLNHEADFYAKMGPFFATRDFVKEMGGWQFYTMPGAIWLVSLSDDSVVQGFCMVLPKKSHIFMDNFNFVDRNRNLMNKTIKACVQQHLYPIRVSEVFEHYHPHQFLCRLIMTLSAIPYWA